jgi:ATP-dependent RNA circularization protein (DNA/RNA ligase family)
MIEYHKIQSVYLRDPANHHKTFLEGQWSLPEFGYLARNEWHWTEKVDGTNVRVHWDGEKVTLGGRTADAQMPLFLVHRLEALFPRVNFQTHFPRKEENGTKEILDVMLVGEGYGAKIQKGGGNYGPVDFVLFDVMVGGVYLERHNVEDVAQKMGLRVVPIVGKGSLEDAIAMTRAGFDSTWGPFKAEGLVMRPAVELVTRRGHRLITKVKHKDFVTR